MQTCQDQGMDMQFDDGKLINVLMKLHFLEVSQRSVKEIRHQIERYELRNLELVSKWPNGMPEWARNEK
jgi:hypothetical protein